MIRIYLSHPIRGKDGPNATEETMKANNQRAIEFGNKLKVVYPTVDFYVPGNHDEFVLIAYKNGFLTEKEILDVDCEIVSRCGVVLALSPDGYLSNGMRIEIAHAQANCIPVYIVNDIEEAIRRVGGFLESKKR